MDQQQHQERPREVYRECMRNHVAKLGTYASDGCCEYTPDDGQPAAMLRAACGCHRNFHRKAFLDAAGGAHSAMLPSISPPCHWCLEATPPSVPAVAWSSDGIALLTPEKKVINGAGPVYSGHATSPKPGWFWQVDIE